MTTDLQKPIGHELITELKVIADYQLANDEEYATAGLVSQSLQRLKKEWEAEQEKATRALKDEYDRRRALYKPVLDTIATAMRDLKDVMGRYVLEQRRKQDALLAAAAKASEPIAEMTLVREARQAAAPALKGITQKVVNVAVVIDERLVPDKYWRRVLDMAHVQSDTDAGVSIPGVVVQQQVKTTVRGGK